MGAIDGYASDDLDDYEDDYEGEEEELSPEDKAAMSKGTADVQTALGADSKKITVKQIQEALWHYYYDVEKSVGYLRKTFLPAQPKPAPKKAPEGMSDNIFFLHSQDPSADALGATGPSHGACCGLGGHGMSHGRLESPPFGMSMKSRTPIFDFSDMPWFNVPEHRKTTFVAPPRPRGGLLGGADPPKMSKLQALALARKKKTEGKKDQEQATQGIRKLSISGGQDATKKENRNPTFPKRQKLSEPEKQAVPSSHEVLQDLQPASDASIGRRENDLRKQEEDKQEAMDIEPPPTMAAASAFAQTLFNRTPRASRWKDSDTFAFPYTRHPSFNAAAFDEPSPDDVVLAAQAKAGKKAPAAKAAVKADKEPAMPESDLTDSVSNLKIKDIPPSKSKEIDVIREFENSKAKKSLSFVVVGHVDAGKSTLMGRLLVDLKYVEQRTVDKFRKLGEKTGKQSFAFAWVMDQRSEERDRGVTIDIATNYFETSTTKYTILDAPGHRDFVPNMIAGASQADFAIVVIDANTGAYEKGLKGQTREHVLLLRSLGVQRLIIAVNKLDMVQWSKARFDEITQQITGFLTGLGFQEKHVTFVPISGLNGDNITKDIEDKAASWYSGGTLVDALEASGPSGVRALKKPFRMPISEVFRSQQGTTTLAGKIDSGTMQVGEVVFVEPSGETAYIKSISVDTDSQDWGVAGQNVSVALTNIDPVHIRVGDILCHTTDAIPSADEFTMKAMAFEHLMPMPVDIHRGRLHSAGQIKSITATIDKATGEIIKKRPKVVQPGGVARVKIKLAAKVPLEAGQRVVIRSGGETIAAGLVE